jgi:hypothetical protein
VLKGISYRTVFVVDSFWIPGYGYDGGESWEKRVLCGDSGTGGAGH